MISSRLLAVLALAVLALAVPLWAGAADLVVKVRDDKGAAVAHAVVTLTPTGQLPRPPAQRVEVSQAGQEFSPLVTVVPVGSTVLFPNRDTVAHHVYSFSPACTFDLPLYTGAAPREVTCSAAGLITLGCNIHDWMTAFVVVTETPWYGQSGADGLVTLRDVPAGPAEVKVWHPRQRAAAPGVSVSLPQAEPVSFALSLRPEPKRRRAPGVGGAGGYR